MGVLMIISGGIFVFLAKYKNMSDDELQRALSLNTAANKQIVKKGVVDFAHNNKDTIA